MQKIAFPLKSALVGLVLLAISACTATQRLHGYVPSELDLENVIVGVDTQQTVAASIGRPSAAGILDTGGWYYVQSRWRHFAWRAPRETDRQVLAISFDEEGVVENIERFGLEDGNVVVLSRRVTDSNIKGISFLRQLLGNLGNFTADQFLRDG